MEHFVEIAEVHVQQVEVPAQIASPYVIDQYVDRSVPFDRSGDDFPAALRLGSVKAQREGRGALAVQLLGQPLGLGIVVIGDHQPLGRSLSYAGRGARHERYAAFESFRFHHGASVWFRYRTIIVRRFALGRRMLCGTKVDRGG